jgi:hypothetical protein
VSQIVVRFILLYIHQRHTFCQLLGVQVTSRLQGTSLYTGEVLYGLQRKYCRQPGLRRVSKYGSVPRTFKVIYEKVGIPKMTVYDRIAGYKRSIGELPARVTHPSNLRLLAPESDNASIYLYCYL